MERKTQYIFRSRRLEKHKHKKRYEAEQKRSHDEIIANISHLAEGNALGLKLGDADGTAVGNGVGSVVGSGVTGRFVGLPDLTDGIGEGFVLGARVEGVLDGCIRAKSSTIT